MTYHYDVILPDGRSVSRNLHERFPGIGKGEFRSIYARGRFKKNGPIESREFHGELTLFGTVNCKIKVPNPAQPGRFSTWTLNSHHIIDIL